MSRKLPLVDHWSIEPDDIEALIALYDATPIAELPENWRRVEDEQMSEIWEANNAVSEGRSEADWRTAPPPNPVEITLPEIMQCFKTLVHFDWIKELGRGLVADGVLDIPYEDFWAANWPLDEPYERSSAVGGLEGFLYWWPVWCGYDVMTGKFGSLNRHYHAVMAPIFRATLLKITYDDPHMVFDIKNLGGIVNGLREYGG